MNINNTLITALRALSRNKMQSGLTSLGIIIGISSVIIMMGLGSSAQITVQDKVASFGVNTMSVLINQPYSFNDYDLDVLKRTFPQIKYITPIIELKKVFLKHNKYSLISQFWGVNNDYFAMKNYSISAGRLFTNEEIETNSKVAIVGMTIVRELFQNRNPLQEPVIINGIPFNVVGVIKSMGKSLSRDDFDNLVIIPHSTAINTIQREIGYNQLYIASHDEKMLREIKNILSQYIENKVGLNIEKSKDLYKINLSTKKMQMAKDISQALTYLLIGIASISLFVGGIGIMNIMLASVSERTREIGIRMAIGAKKKDILLQFILETVILTIMGGVAGIILGLIVYTAIISMTGWPFIFSPKSIILSLVFSTIVGVFFGYYPARKAAIMKPIDALKYE
jgi:putative ABC transport system permease protein